MTSYCVKKLLITLTGRCNSLAERLKIILKNSKLPPTGINVCLPTKQSVQCCFLCKRNIATLYFSIKGLLILPQWTIIEKK